MSGDLQNIRWTKLDQIACGQCGATIDVSQFAPFSTVECPQCGVKQTVPAQLGQFLLVEQLGMGGMGAVYRAMDATLGRFVAIKVMKAEMGEDLALVESFLREARAAAALNHPNIVQMYSCGQEQGQPYIVMELVSGGRLDLMMEDGKKKVDEVRLLEIALEVAEGLKAADEAHLVHGDIKPANILLDKNGRARIADFGLATFVNRQQEQGGVWGTPYYISPERARGGHADHRSDIYSLGATMFHALAARPPFDGKTAADVVVARLKGPPPKLIDIEPGIQPTTSNLIDRMLAADPVRRYPTSASLLADMRAALDAARAARSPAGRDKKKKGRAALLIAAAAVLLLAAGGGYFWMKQREPPARVKSSSRTVKGTRTTRKGTSTAPKKPVEQAKESAVTNVVAQPPAADAVYDVNEGGRARKGSNFFGEISERELIRACGELSSQPERMNEQIAPIIGREGADSAAGLWLQLLQVPAYWAQGDTARANDALRSVSRSGLKVKRGHPHLMPQTLARYLNGDIRDDQFVRDSQSWPLWFGDLAQFFRGARTLFSGDAEAAAGPLTAYLRNERAAPAWAYAFRPSAQKWIDAVSNWESVRRDALAQAASGNLAAAQSGLDAFTQTAPAYLSELVAQAQRQVKSAREKGDYAAFVERERARSGTIQRDLDRVDEWIGEKIMMLVQQKEFRKLSIEARVLESRMETPEGKEQLRILREQLDRMDGLKAMLISDLSATPFQRNDRELGGQAVGATVLGIRISAPGQGMLTRPWEQVSPRLFVLLLQHVAENTLDPKVRADRLVSIAIVSAYFGGYEAAANFANQARELDPALEPTIRRLLSDSAPGGGKS